MYTIATTRFNNNTWIENKRWRENKNIASMVYGFPKTIPQIIPVNSMIFIMDMNNDTNQVIGISLIRNNRILKGVYNVYNDNNYNRYIYKTQYRINRDEMNEKELDFIKKFDLLLFKGKSHLKRGQGVTKIPDKLLQTTNEKNLLFLKHMFLNHFDLKATSN